MGNDTRFIGVEERTPAYVHIIISKDGMTRTYSIKVHQDQIVDPDPHNMQQQLVRVGKVGKSVLDEIIHWIRSCYLRKRFNVDNVMRRKMIADEWNYKEVDGRTTSHWRTSK